MNRKEQISPLLLRAIIGTGFIIHGWAKISRGTAGFEKLLILKSVPFPHLAATIIPYVELFGGFVILLGIYVVIIAVPLIITMLTAIFTIHIQNCYSSVNTIGLTPDGPKFGPPGYEINLLYIAGLISLILTGAGNFSVDYLIKKKRHKLK